jgi:ferredoxin-NADP reductase
MTGTDLPPLPPLPPLPTIGPVTRRVPPGGARRQWQRAPVLDIRNETAVAKTFRLLLDQPARHLPGQHYVVRVTAGDGSQASRSYSLASAPDETGRIELTVERVADGDVSPYLHDEVQLGDRLELRGPFGGWFVWRGDQPSLLIGGGSGVVPLRAMLRHWRATGRRVPLRLVVSVRAPRELFYADEYGDETSVLYTRQAPTETRLTETSLTETSPTETRPVGRLGPDDLRPLLAGCGLAGADDVVSPGDGVAYVCGSAGFAEHASQLLVELGVDPGRVRVERFGPS